MQVIASKALEGVILKAIHGGGEGRSQVRLGKTCEVFMVSWLDSVSRCMRALEGLFSGNQDQGGEVNKQA